MTSNLTVNTNTLHVDSVEGRVGLGTTLPTKTLDVVGTGKISSNLNVGTDAFHVDTNTQRIGIGTTMPTEVMEVKPNQTSGLVSARFGNLVVFSTDDISRMGAESYASSTNTGIFQEPRSAGAHTSLNCATGRSVFLRSKNQSGSMESVFKGGKFGVGTNAPLCELDVNGEIRQDGLPYIWGRGKSGFSDAANNIYLDGLGNNIMVRSGNDILIPSGYNGVYHVSFVCSSHTSSSGVQSRGYGTYIVRTRGSTESQFGLTTQHAKYISGSSYKQAYCEALVDCQGGDTIHFQMGDWGGSTAIHDPNTFWYARMICPT